MVTSHNYFCFSIINITISIKYNLLNSYEKILIITGFNINLIGDALIEIIKL